MQFDELNAEIREFCDEREWEQFHTPKDLAIGLSTESNELLEQFRFKDEQEQTAHLEDPDSREAIEDELADSTTPLETNSSERAVIAASCPRSVYAVGLRSSSPGAISPNGIVRFSPFHSQSASARGRNRLCCNAVSYCSA
jgi:NTP pyrophosphatase (non-canonical NTP hydrolase)